jgi:pilus assembly protein Flp/PilA
MPKFWVNTRELQRRLRTNADGVASFEYLIVAASVIAAASAVFGGTGTGSIQAAVTAGLAAITAAA